MKTTCPFCRGELVDGGKVGTFLFHADAECPMAGIGYSRRDWQRLRKAFDFALYGTGGLVPCLSAVLSKEAIIPAGGHV